MELNALTIIFKRDLIEGFSTKGKQKCRLMALTVSAEPYIVSYYSLRFKAILCPPKKKKPKQRQQQQQNKQTNKRMGEGGVTY